MDRSRCAHHPAACEGCLGEFLLQGTLPDRGCLREPVDDGKRELTIRVPSGDQFGILTITEQNLEEIVYHGWMHFAELFPETFGNLPPAAPANPVE
jgi:hypothetical protein